MDMEKLLAGIEKPGRYIGNETNTYCKDFEESQVRFALAFPDVYEVGLSHLGLHLIYHTLNRMGLVMADRVYSPWPDFEERLRATGEPIRTIESGRALSDFDFVGFSLQYELSFSNILNLLDLGKIPFYAKNRGPEHPWIIAGGPCAFNPEPLADIFDFVVLGEAEEALADIVRVFQEWKASHGSRQEFLEAVRNIPGVYVPSFFDVSYKSDGAVAEILPRFSDYTNVKKRLIADLDNGSPLSDTPLVSLVELIHDRLNMEIARGCTRGCRFCQAGFIYRPVRERSPHKLLEWADRALANSGFEELSLLSLSSGDYCQIQPLLAALMERSTATKVAVSLPSMRVGTLTPELMELIRRVRKTGFTLAPEAASERLRRVINKGIRDEDLLSTAENAFSLGWRLIKLYFMMGLPTETEQDLSALVDRCRQVLQIAKRWRANINVSVSTFVPKPHTPFQWFGQLPIDSIKENLTILSERLKQPGLRFKWSDPGQSRLEAVFARGDRRLAEVLVRAWRLGVRFDGWTERFREDLWEEAFHEAGLDQAFYAERQLGLEEVLPWDHLSSGVDKEFLRKEYERAMAEDPTPDCRFESCSRCGVCDHKTVQPRLHRENIVLSQPKDHTARQDEQPFTYHLRYSKTGPSRFFGQLEVSHSLSRAVRRCGWAAAYSKGFHPHMKISFSGALPLGLESLVEDAYLTLAEMVVTARIQSELNAQLPDGIKIEGVTQVPKALAPPPCRRVTYRISCLTPWEVISIVRNRPRRVADILVKRTKKRELKVELGKVLLDLRQVGENCVDMDLYEGPDMCFRPLAVLHHLMEGAPDCFSGCRICKVAVEPMEESEDVRRTYHQC